ncbi:uncharacterized protein [Miscanthus floridulus]|uniref:uncharacterized protein isoform X2 n=1 Tax=Miscanthus floridulus TaxID=154761 RepID=UPI003458AE98
MWTPFFHSNWAFFSPFLFQLAVHHGSALGAVVPPDGAAFCLARAVAAAVRVSVVSTAAAFPASAVSAAAADSASVLSGACSLRSVARLRLDTGIHAPQIQQEHCLRIAKQGKTSAQQALHTHASPTMSPTTIVPLHLKRMQTYTSWNHVLSKRKSKPYEIIDTSRLHTAVPVHQLNEGHLMHSYPKGS